MLARFSTVDKEGKFHVLGDLRSLYMIMSGTRVGIMMAVFQSLQRSNLIATRYAVCRRQFKNEQGSQKERKLLDYQTHMATIGPHVSGMFILMFTAQQISDLVQSTQQQIIKSNDYKNLEILHHLTAGFKAYYADYGYAALDQLRQSCGGTGFLMASGLAYNQVTHAPHPTHEGVNVVMY